MKGPGGVIFLDGEGTNFDAIRGSDGTDFFVTVDQGMFGKEGGGGKLEGSEARSIKGGGSGLVFFGVGNSFFWGEGGLPQAQCLTLAILGSSEDIIFVFRK